MQFSFLIGTHRSGTTWLGSLLSKARETAYWVEPRQVWTYRNWLAPSDRLDASDVSDRIRSHIRRRFREFAASQSASHFIEKTPSNCFRIPFMQEVFPEGRFILLIRDGRGVIRSSDEIRHRGPDPGRVLQRLRESRVRELPALEFLVVHSKRRLSN